MTWRLARGLEKLRAQVNEKWPNRSKDSDGSIGDAKHSSRTSDHNPDPHGIVRAIDITHDPRDGLDSYAFADMLLSKQDPRLKYIISNYRIGSGPAGPAPGVWRPYNVPPNANPHDHHVHVSIMPRRPNGTDPGDDDSTWDIDGVVADPDVVAKYVPPHPTLRKGKSGEDVRNLQIKLGMEADGIFGPKTELALKAYQASKGLVVDGICGPQVWKSLA